MIMSPTTSSDAAARKPLPAADAADPPCSKPAGRPRAADREARLHSLLETAACLFLRQGYGNVSLEMIAREAHVAVRTIYVKFGGKAGLFNAVIQRGRARYFAGMNALDTDMRPIGEVLGEFSMRFLELVFRTAAVGLHRMVIAEAKSNPELAHTFNQAGPGLTRELLGRYFARPDIKALFRPEIPHEMLAVHLLNCLMGDQLSRLLFEPAAEPSEADNRAQVALGLDLFFRATLRQPPA